MTAETGLMSPKPRKVSSHPKLEEAGPGSPLEPPKEPAWMAPGF